MTPRETDEWNLRVNRPLICWSVEKPGTMLLRDDAEWAVVALAIFVVAAPFGLLAAIMVLK